MRALGLAMAIAFGTSHGQWVQTGGPAVGNIYSFAGQDGKLFAVTGGIVYVTGDLGNQWKSLPSPPGRAFSLAADGDYLFAATDTEGIHRSSDGGKTWVPVNQGLPGPNMSALAASEGALVAALQFHSGIYRSTDQGTSWTRVLETGRVRSFTFAGDRIFAVMNKETYSGLLWRSSDKGLTWQKLEYALCCTEQDVAVKDSLVFLAVDGIHGLGGVYRSADWGVTWTQVWNNVANRITVAGQAIYLGTSGSGIYRSQDDGASWTQVHPGNKDVPVNAFGVSGGRIFVAMGGVLRSADQGATWQPADRGIAELWVQALAESRGSLLASGFMKGLYRSADSGASWSPVMPETFQTVNPPLATHGDTLLTGKDSLIFLSTNGGASWSTLKMGQNIGLTALAADGRFIYAGAGGRPYRTGDGGKTWTLICNPETEPRCAEFGDLREILIRGSQIVLVAGPPASSRDGGKTWDFHPYNSFVTAAYHGPYIVASDGLTMFRSADSGKSWDTVTTGLNGLLLHSLLSTGNILLAGTSQGVYRSDNQGAAWYPYDHGMEGKGVLVLAMGKTHLLAGTHANSVWRRPKQDLVTSISLPVPGTESGIQLGSHGPLMPGSRIDLTLARRSAITLSLYDLRGRRVKTLVNATLSPGTHPIRMDAGPLPGGVYFLRLQAEGSVRTRRVTLE